MLHTLIKAISHLYGKVGYLRGKPLIFTWPYDVFTVPMRMRHTKTLSNVSERLNVQLWVEVLRLEGIQLVHSRLSMKAVLVEEEVANLRDFNGAVEFMALGYGSINDATVAQILRYQRDEERLQIGSNAVTKHANSIEIKIEHSYKTKKYVLPATSLPKIYYKMIITKKRRYL